MTQYVMRPSRLDDLDALIELAELSGPGFTSLPVDQARLTERLENSLKAFSGQLDEPQYGKYLMMMEHRPSGEVAGCAAVKAGTGIHEPFFNYRIITIAQTSQAAGKRYDMDVLVLTNEFVGYTEVGTLFLKAEHRGSGIGRMAAQSRYLLMATDETRFGEKVLAELRGVIDEDGRTPFWECLGKHFFKMTFREADHLSAVSDNQFILDLMPKYPVYIDLLPPEAAAVIGRCHADGVGAMKLLEWEGFRFERTVDIFDGGPMVACAREHIRTIRESRRVTVRAGTIDEPTTGMISNDRLEDFRCMKLEGQLMNEDEIILSTDILETLRLNPGDRARMWVRT
ncbi:MAG: arginine N-succinyltransferase [Pseudomonadota bacterium]